MLTTMMEPLFIVILWYSIHSRTVCATSVQLGCLLSDFKTKESLCFILVSYYPFWVFISLSKEQHKTKQNILNREKNKTEKTSHSKARFPFVCASGLHSETLASQLLNDDIKAQSCNGCNQASNWCRDLIHIVWKLKMSNYKKRETKRTKKKKTFLWKAVTQHIQHEPCVSLFSHYLIFSSISVRLLVAVVCHFPLTFFPSYIFSLLLIFCGTHR